MADPPAVSRHERARLLYADNSQSIEEIARQLGVSSRTISSWARAHGWPRRGTASRTAHHRPKPIAAPDAPGTASAAATPARRNRRAAEPPAVGALVDRLYRIIAHNLELMETRMSDDGTPAGDNERDIRAIGTIVRSVEKLKELEPDQAKRAAAGTGRYPLTPEEEDKLRRELVERLLELHKRRRDRGDGPLPER